MDDDPQLLVLADTVSEILADLGADERLDTLAEQMGRLIAEFQPVGLEDSTHPT